MASPLTNIIHETIDELTEAQRPTAAEIADFIITSHPTAFQEYAETTAKTGLLGMVKSALRRRFDETNGAQLSLPGLELPSIIAVHDEETGRDYYVKAINATWQELQAGLRARKQHLAAAQSKLDTYEASLKLVEATMSANRSMTLSEAIRIITCEKGN